jgi:cell division protein FtsN
MNAMYLKKKKNKKLIYIYLILILTSIFIFLISFNIFNINKKNYSNTKNKIFIKHSTSDAKLPPKPKEKWKYIHILKNL